MVRVYRIPIKKKKRNFLTDFSTNNWIIFITVLAWLVIRIFLAINPDPDVLKYFALQPIAFIQGKYLWTIFTSMFSHIYFWHIFANMITLAFIGGFVQKLIGSKRYLWFYLTAGLFAGLFFVLLSLLFGNSELGLALFGSPEIFALGASGAVFGLAGLITMLIPKMKVLAFFVIPMPMWLAMVFFLGVFWILSVFAGLPIGNSAHLGGFLIGMVYGIYLKNKFPNKTRILKKRFS